MATITAYFPDDSDLLIKIRDRATRFHDNKVSAYARACIERDLQSEAGDMLRMPSPVDPYVMDKLARVLLGHVKAGRMSSVMHGRDQVAELTDLLELHLQERERERNRLIAEEAAPYGAAPPTAIPADAARAAIAAESAKRAAAAPRGRPAGGVARGPRA